ncbi:hypothetical protein MHBO_000661 [Bonamia ostreae]|uniref:Uncharacterized protein n=1 Tax=Bonamia ostreae TaxID=126728 RepID=A0ABV2AGE3_9EUKA
MLDFKLRTPLFSYPVAVSYRQTISFSYYNQEKRYFICTQNGEFTPTEGICEDINLTLKLEENEKKETNLRHALQKLFVLCGELVLNYNSKQITINARIFKKLEKVVYFDEKTQTLIKIKNSYDRKVLENILTTKKIILVCDNNTVTWNYSNIFYNIIDKSNLPRVCRKNCPLSKSLFKTDFLENLETQKIFCKNGEMLFYDTENNHTEGVLDHNFKCKNKILRLVIEGIVVSTEAHYLRCVEKDNFINNCGSIFVYKNNQYTSKNIFLYCDNNIRIKLNCNENSFNKMNVFWRRKIDVICQKINKKDCSINLTEKRLVRMDGQSSVNFIPGNHLIGCKKAEENLILGDFLVDQMNVTCDNKKLSPSLIVCKRFYFF